MRATEKVDCRGNLDSVVIIILNGAKMAAVRCLPLATSNKPVPDGGLVDRPPLGFRDLPIVAVRGTVIQATHASIVA